MQVIPYPYIIIYTLAVCLALHEAKKSILADPRGKAIDKIKEYNICNILGKLEETHLIQTHMRLPKKLHFYCYLPSTPLDNSIFQTQDDKILHFDIGKLIRICYRECLVDMAHHIYQNKYRDRLLYNICLFYV